MCPKLLGNGMRYTGFSWMRMNVYSWYVYAAGFSCVRKGPWWEFFILIFFFFFEVNSSLSAGCGRGRGCFVVVEKWVR